MKDKELVLKMLDSVKDLVEAAKNIVDNDERPVEKSKPVKKKRGRPPKKKQESSEAGDFTMKKAGTSRTPQVTHNKFEQMIGLEVDKPEGYDNIDDGGPRSPRIRGEYESVKMICEECNKVFAVNPIFKKDNYICDRCVGKKFGR